MQEIKKYNDQNLAGMFSNNQNWSPVTFKLAITTDFRVEQFLALAEQCMNDFDFEQAQDFLEKALERLS